MPKSNILIVDDRPENLYTLEKLLQKLDVNIARAESGFEALEHTLEREFCLAIVDVQMPEMDGYELVELLRSNEGTSTLPVIFVSAIYSDEYHHRKGYDAGAVDFLSKPFVPEILLSKVQIFLELCQQRQQLQSLVNQLNTTNTALSKFTKQLQTSNQVSQQITSILDTNALLQAVVDLIQTKFNYYFAGVWLWDTAREHIVLQAWSGRATGKDLKKGVVLSQRHMRGIVGSVCVQGRSRRVNDVRRSPLYIPMEALPLTRSELAVPLRIGETTLGVVDIQSENTSAFDIQDVDVLQALADQIAIAIRNATLYAQVTQFNEELEAKVEERTEELQKAYSHLELLDRNKSDFISVVSHELHTPLTLIQGYGQILSGKKEITANPKLHDQISNIAVGAERMREIVDTMLDMARIDMKTLKLVIEPVSLSIIFDTLRETFAAALQERALTLNVADFDVFPFIQADPVAIAKLFEQLFTNAIKYTPDEGCINIEGKLLEAEDDTSPEFLEVTISDTGIGIDLESQELIFTKFYTTGEVATHSTGKTKFKGGGPGLGLSIAKGIAEAHGGRVWAESPGYDEATCPGSQFHVVLPIKQPE
jgi:signal transduction histidine kinase/CheY-like chemotaxis protein